MQGKEKFRFILQQTGRREQSFTVEIFVIQCLWVSSHLNNPEIVEELSSGG